MISAYQPFWIAVLSCVVVFVSGSYARYLAARRRQREAQTRRAFQEELRTIHARERAKQQLLEALLEEMPGE